MCSTLGGCNSVYICILLLYRRINVICSLRYVLLNTSCACFHFIYSFRHKFPTSSQCCDFFCFGRFACLLGCLPWSFGGCVHALLSFYMCLVRDPCAFYCTRFTLYYCSLNHSQTSLHPVSVVLFLILFLVLCHSSVLFTFASKVNSILCVAQRNIICKCVFPTYVW